MRTGTSYAEPTFIKSDEGLLNFADFESRHYVAISGADIKAIENEFGKVKLISEGDEIAFIQFMNDMCFCYSHMYDMTSGDSEDYEFIGADGIKYIAICRFLDDFSIDIPIINNIIY
jgi:hypothetical protein